MTQDPADPLLQFDNRRLRQIRRLTEMSRTLTTALSVNDVFSLAVSRAADLFDASTSLLMCWDDNERWVLHASTGIGSSTLARHAALLDAPLDTQLAVLCGDRLSHLLAAPLVVSDEVFGLLGVVLDSEVADANHEEWCLSAFADQVAIGLEKTRLDETAAFRERLLGIVGHDLRNPLQAIQMTAEALSVRGGSDDGVTTHARRIVRMASQMSDMIAQLLDFTRSRLGGGIELTLSKMDLKRAIRRLVSDFAASQPRATFATDLDGKLTGHWDRQRVDQLISNLLRNAVCHGDLGRPIRVTAREESGYAVVEVHNFGEPIPPEQQRDLFSPFRRSQHPRSGATPGLGLGLYIANEITNAHGGEIHVHSSQDGGTEFCVRLPLTGEFAAPRALFRPS